MMAPAVTGATRVAGVVGAPIRHSLSPLIQNAWLRMAGIDAVYVPFAPDPVRFEAFIDGMRAAGLVGLNITAPFKERALRLADRKDSAATGAGASNLLLFKADGALEARNTDGAGLLAAFAEQAPAWRPTGRPSVVLGAGGAARGAISALVAAGGTVRIVNRTYARAERLAQVFTHVEPFAATAIAAACTDAGAVINALPAVADQPPDAKALLRALPQDAVVMDMVYAPLRTALLVEAAHTGRVTVDGLAMLIGQAKPSFEAMFGVPPAETLDVRALALVALGDRS